MKINDYGQITISDNEAFQALYSGKITDLDDVYIDNNAKIKEYNSARDINADRIAELQSLITPTVSLDEFDKANQNKWFMPEDYFPNLIEYLYGCCTTPDETDRVSQELELFSQYGMINVLFYCKYLVDTMRANNIVWGVGRGSAVASYVLYLIGMHKINSIKYELDINEFLK